MCQKSNTIAHDLFYPLDAEKERESPGGRFSIHRGRDFSVAYSYSTPIAVYPDNGEFVLLDSTHFSQTTSKHQYSIRQAIPYNVRRIECDWMGKNNIWYAPRHDSFQTQFRKFTKDIAKGIANIGKSDGDFAYSRKRNETLNRLNGYRKLAEVSSIKQTMIAQLERRVAAITEPKRILAAQKRAVKKRADERKRIRKRQQEDKLLISLNKLFETNETVEKAVSEAAEQLLNRIPYPEWRWLPEAAPAARGEPARQILSFTRNAVRDVAEGIWRHKYGQPLSTDDCDLRWHSDGLFHTTKGVAIRYAELQRCLELWKSRRFLGEVVDNRYQVLRNDEDSLIIGCHYFKQETVQRIWERYAGKTPKTIAQEETERKQETENFICLVMQPLLKLVQREFRKTNQLQTT